MTIETQTKTVTVNGNDSATSFSFSDLVIYANTELEVTHVVVATQVETPLALTTDFAVVVASYPGTGTITFPEGGSALSTLATGESLVIKRKIVLEQTTDLENQGGYFPDVQETAHDKAVVRDLQQQEELDRTVKIPISDTTVTSVELPTPVADTVIGVWSSDATTIVAGPTASAISGADASATAAAASEAAAAVSETNAAASEAAAAASAGVFGTKGADIASATTITVGTDGTYFDITGSTGPIGTLTVSADRNFYFQFDSTPTLTHHATNLDLPGEADITAAAGDVAHFQSTGANTVQCVSYTRADGTAIEAVLATENNTWSGSQKSTVTALTSSSNSIAISMLTTNDYSHTFTENTTLANPSDTLVAGQTGTIYLTQHASSPKTLAFGSEYDFVGGTVPTVTATNSARDTLHYAVRADGKIEITALLNQS